MHTHLASLDGHVLKDEGKLELVEQQKTALFVSVSENDRLCQGRASTRKMSRQRPAPTLARRSNVQHIERELMLQRWQTP